MDVLLPVRIFTVPGDTCFCRALSTAVSLTKGDLLTYLVHAGEVDAQDVALEFGVGYSVAAMALLRLVRQGLASRHRSTERGAYRYRPSERGQSRLAYLQTRRENTE